MNQFERLKQLFTAAIEEHEQILSGLKKAGRVG